MRPGVGERFRVLLLLRDWRDSSEFRQREGRHQPTFTAEDPHHPPTGMSNFIRDETREESEGFFELPNPSGMRQLRIHRDPQLWWRKRGAIFYVKKCFPQSTISIKTENVCQTDNNSVKKRILITALNRYGFGRENRS